MRRACSSASAKKHGGQQSANKPLRSTPHFHCPIRMKLALKFSPIPVYCGELFTLANTDGARDAALVLKKDQNEYLVWRDIPTKMIHRAERLRRRGCFPFAFLTITEMDSSVRLRLRAIEEFEHVPGIDEALDSILDCLEEELDSLSQSPLLN